MAAVSSRSWAWFVADASVRYALRCNCRACQDPAHRFIRICSGRGEVASDLRCEAMWATRALSSQLSPTSLRRKPAAAIGRPGSLPDEY